MRCPAGTSSSATTSASATATMRTPSGVATNTYVAVGLDDVTLVDADLLGVGARVVLSFDCLRRATDVRSGLRGIVGSAAMSPSAITRPSP